MENSHFLGAQTASTSMVCCNAVCKVKPGEDVATAAAREGKEELGIIIVEGREISSFVSENWRLHVYEVCSADMPLYEYKGRPRNAEPDKHAGGIACTFIKFMTLSYLMSEPEGVLPSNRQILETL